jgi:hypothetical protein
VIKKIWIVATNRDVCLEVNTEKSRYMFMSPHQNELQNHENVAQFRYLGSTIRNQNLILEEINSRLNSDNACCHLV